MREAAREEGRRGARRREGGAGRKEGFRVGLLQIAGRSGLRSKTRAREIDVRDAGSGKAKKAGRPYPNLIDNMKAAKKKKRG